MYAPNCPLIFTMCELVLKEKTMSLVWNYFGFEADEDGKLINTEKPIYCVASGCRKKPVSANSGCKQAFGKSANHTFSGGLSPQVRLLKLE